MTTFLNTYKGHYKALIHLGVPIMIGQLGTIILSFADTFMIGRYGTPELGAASFVNNIFNLVIIFSTGFSYGLTPVVGGAYGRGEFEAAGHAMKCSLLANFLVSILLTLGMLALFLNLERIGQPKELMPLIKPYYLTLLATIVFIFLFNTFRQFADGITSTKTAMWILLAGNLLNIAGNYLLIYGKFGFPEMGLLGAGISTLFSRIFMVVVFVVIFFKTSRFSLYSRGFRSLRITGETVKKLNRLGWPIGLQMGMETATFSLSAVMLGWLGTIALASHQVMSTITTLAFLLYYGMGAALAVRVSNFSGQRDWVNVRRSTYAGLHLMVFMVIVFSFLLYLFRNQLGGWFTDSEEVTETVLTLMVPMLLFQFGDGLQITFANALRGISDVKPMMFIAFISYFIISLPVGYLLGFTFGWGAPGVWMAFPFGLTSAGMMFLFRFRYRLRKLEQTGR